MNNSKLYNFIGFDLGNVGFFFELTGSTELFPRKEVIQPHLPVRLPCYDFTLIISPTFDAALLAVRLTASGKTNSDGVTGGVYNPRERIHRSVLIYDY